MYIVETIARPTRSRSCRARTSSSSRPTSFRSQSISTRSSGGSVNASSASARVRRGREAASRQSWAITSGERERAGRFGLPSGSQRTSNSIISTPTSTARSKLATVLPVTSAAAPLWPTRRSAPGVVACRSVTRARSAIRPRRRAAQAGRRRAGAGSPRFRRGCRRPRRRRPATRAPQRPVPAARRPRAAAARCRSWRSERADDREQHDDAGRPDETSGEQVVPLEGLPLHRGNVIRRPVPPQRPGWVSCRVRRRRPGSRRSRSPRRPGSSSARRSRRSRRRSG